VDLPRPARPVVTATARSASGRGARSAPSRRRPAGRNLPRRLSGPGSGGGAAVALPGRVLRAPLARAARARAGGVLDALLQGPGWIALIAVLLVGIVFFNVDLLELNRDIAHTADRAARVKRDNARLRLQLARLASTERIQRVAAGRGLELPAPGEVRYVRIHPGADARTAAARIVAPHSAAAAPVSSGTPAPGPADAPGSPTTPGPSAPAGGTQSAPAPTPPSSPPTGASPGQGGSPGSGAPGSPTGGAAPAPAPPTAPAPTGPRAPGG